MQYVITGIILYALFFLLCYLGTGGDRKNIKSFYSYPDAVQEKIRQNQTLSKMIPKRSTYLKSFLLNVMLFSVVFIIIGLVLRFSKFMPAFVYLLILGEGLNLFDLLVIDCWWWSRTKRTHFTEIADDKDYYGFRKHVEAFLRGIPVFIFASLIAAAISTIL